ncbi:unnamed protein product [Pylaiella littoralis]
MSWTVCRWLQASTSKLREVAENNIVLRVLTTCQQCVSDRFGLWVLLMLPPHRRIRLTVVFSRAIAQEKVLNTIVDAKAAAKQDSAATRHKKADAAANTTFMGRLQVAHGNARCGPGARATSFGDAVMADERAMADAQAKSAAAETASGRSGQTTAGGAPSGRSSPTTEDGRPGRSSGRSSPSSGGGPSEGSSGRSSPSPGGGTLSVPPLGNDLALEMLAPSITDLATQTTSTNEEADLFLNAGFTYDLLPRHKATAMMVRVLQGKLCDERADMDVDDYMASFEGSRSEVPGLDGLLLRKLCDHYGASCEDFYTSDDAYRYANGWLDECAPSAAKFKTQTKRLAEVLIPGPPPVAPASSNIGDAAPADAIISLGFSRKSNDGIGNRGTKARKNTNRLEEDGIQGFMREQLQAAEKIASSRMAAEEKEEKNREWMVAQLEHDRKLRQDEFEHQRKIRADERDAERAERKDERAHQLELLSLQLKLVHAQNQGQGQGR